LLGVLLEVPVPSISVISNSVRWIHDLFHHLPLAA
jgi:hypothetical protein